MQKRGLSDVVTTVLIILLALGAVILLWVFVKPLITDNGLGLDTTMLTSSFTIPQSSVKITADQNITFGIKREAGEGNVIGFNVILENSNKESKTIRKDLAINEYELRIIAIYHYEHNLGGSITKISIAPIFLNKNGKEVKGNEAANYVMNNNENIFIQPLIGECEATGPGDCTVPGVNGICIAGTQTCTSGQWGNCISKQTAASSEDCNNQLDDDCNGVTNNGCACTGTQQQPCGDFDLGECKKGTQTCASGQWGNCISAVGPTAEVCDGLDNNCDEVIDEGIECECAGTPSNSLNCNQYDGLKSEGKDTQCTNAGCNVYEMWCNGADANRNTIYQQLLDSSHIMDRINTTSTCCNYEGIAIGTYSVADFDGNDNPITNWFQCSDWCERADVNKDGRVTTSDITALSSRGYVSGTSGCDALDKINIDCYASCSLKTSEASCAKLECIWQAKTTPTNWIDSLKTNLVLYYNGEVTPEGNAKDYMAKHDGVKNGDVAQVDADNGRTGKAFSFDGNGDYFSAADSADLDLSGEFSLSIWINNKQPYTTETSYGLINKYDGNNNKRSYRLILYHTGSKINPSFSYSSDGTFTTKVDKLSNYDLPINSWHHIVFTFSLSGCRFYIDNVASTASCSIINSAVYNSDLPLLIGRDVNNLYLKGSLDEVMIFNKALTQAEVTEIYDNQNK